MSAANKVPSACPICKRVMLVDHCQTGRCGWKKCRNNDCDAVLDVRRKRGHIRNPDPSMTNRMLVVDRMTTLAELARDQGMATATHAADPRLILAVGRKQNETPPLVKQDGASKELPTQKGTT